MRPITIFLVGISNYYAVLWWPTVPPSRPEGYVGSTLLFTNKIYCVTWQVPTPFLLYGNQQLQYKLLVVTESTIIATIHCPDVGYCLFGVSLLTHILCHVPCTFLIVIVSYWVVLSFARLLTPLAPCTQLGYSTLPTMYYWISTSVAISCLFDSITCFVSYILSPLYLCFRT